MGNKQKRSQNKSKNNKFLLKSSKLQDFEEFLFKSSQSLEEFEKINKKQKNNNYNNIDTFLSQYTYTDAPSNLFENGEQVTKTKDYSKIMSDAYQMVPSSSISSSSSSIRENIGPILSCSLLVTGNTVGAGTMVLPEIASGPGTFPSLLVFIGLYLVNVLSGIIIGEVSIQQYEKSSSSEASASS